MSISLSDGDKAAIADAISRNGYGDGYLYLKSIVDARILIEGNLIEKRRLEQLSNWYANAEKINSGQGFVSDYVRMSTLSIAAQLGRPVVNSDFQRASDDIARDILRDAIDNGVVPDIDDVIGRDLRTMSEVFDLPSWAWAATLADHWLCPSLGGFGEDFSAIPEDEHYWQNLTDASQANLAGLSWALLKFRYGIFIDVYTYYIESGVIRNLRDPLALDLNGDGIATIPASAGITFDHNNSGVEYGTGWINPSDGWLALDRNGNGKIDSGRELFGDNTLKLGGNKAAHAYDALASFDSNKDGQISAADATGDIDNNGVIDGAETYWDINNNGVYDASVDKTFADLRVWVDANSNGNTDSGELKTLAEVNIVAIATDKTAVNTVDASGNLNTFVGNYTTASGEVVDGARAFNLVENKFFRQWSNSVNVSPAVAALPNMQGSGAVRDLHEAMSLGTPEAAILKNTVQQFAAATSRNTQYALVDKLIGEWSRTAEFDDMVERLERMTTTYRNFQTNQMAHYEYRFALTTGAFWDDSDDTFNQRNQKVDLIDDPSDKDYLRTEQALDHLYVNNTVVLEGQTAAQAAKIQALAKTRVLEVFNNAQFFDFSASVVLGGTDNPNTPQDERTQSVAFSSKTSSSTQTKSNIKGVASQNIIVMTENDLQIPQSNYMHASYDQLRESVYSALALQTRLKPYMDAIEIRLDVSGSVVFDFAAFDAQFANKLASQPVNGVLDLLDVLSYRGADLAKSGWDAEAAFAQIKTAVAGMSSVQLEQLGSTINLRNGILNNTNVSSEKTANTLSILSDSSTAGSYIRGPVGNFVIGGAANDNLISSCSSAVCGQGNDVLFGGAGNDGLHGNEGDDKLFGGSGNDTMYGHDGDDYLFGGDGNDSTMNGGAGNDWLDGGAGNDSLTDNAGFDVMRGGLGDDKYYFNGGNNRSPGDVDTILFGRGDGSDEINTGAKEVDQLVQLYFEQGILPEHIQVRRVSQALHFDLLDPNNPNATDSVKVSYFFTGGNTIDTRAIDSVVFANGVVWDRQAIIAGLFQGTDGYDDYRGLADRDDVMYGKAGNDYMNGYGGNDTLYGEDGNDTLRGEDGDDILDGGAGTDHLYGGAGADTLIFGVGYGQDRAYDVTAEDMIKFAANVVADDIVITRTTLFDDCLEVTFKSSSADKLLLNAPPKEFVLHDGTVLATYQHVGDLKDRVFTVQRGPEVGVSFLVAEDFLGTMLPAVEAMRWQVGAGTVASNGFYNNVDFDGDGINDPTFAWLPEHPAIPGRAAVAFLPNVNATTSRFMLELAKDAPTGLLLRANMPVITVAGNSITGADNSDDILEGSISPSALSLYGLGGHDFLFGTWQADILDGGDGDDILIGSWGSDQLYGGAGSDYLGGEFDSGDDLMVGGAGSDTYALDLQGDHDWIDNYDVGALAADVDVVAISNLTDFQQLWFSRSTGTDDLIIQSVGQSGSATIQDWFANPAAGAGSEQRLDRLDVIQVDDVKYEFLLDSNFDGLIQAMSTLPAPSSLIDVSTAAGYQPVRDAWQILATPAPQ